jgi:hypothetical protein
MVPPPRPRFPEPPLLQTSASIPLFDRHANFRDFLYNNLLNIGHYTASTCQIESEPILLHFTIRVVWASGFKLNCRRFRASTAQAVIDMLHTMVASGANYVKKANESFGSSASQPACTEC